MEVGFPVIIEGNFVPYGIKNVDEADAIKKLVDKYNYQSLTFKFTGDTKVLHKRFVEREGTPERGQANTMFKEVKSSYFDTWCHNLDKFDIGGKVVKVDTTDFNHVNFANHIETARLHLKI